MLSGHLENLFLVPSISLHLQPNQVDVSLAHEHCVLIARSPRSLLIGHLENLFDAFRVGRRHIIHVLYLSLTLDDTEQANNEHLIRCC